MSGEKQKEDENENNSETEFVRWFKDLNKNSGSIAGGKGANLAEIYNLGIPVPPGFVVTAQAYSYFIEKAGIKEKISEILGKIDYEDTKQLDESTQKIRKIITKSPFPKDMKEEILESYEHLGAADYDFEKGDALDILNTGKEPIFVAVRSSATTEDLAEASFAGQQDTYLNIKGEPSLLKNIKKCFASLFTSRATYYRFKKGFEHEKSYLAVVVQKMINSDKSGVSFSKDPTYNSDNVIIESVWGLGEGIVSGKITPDKYEVSPDKEILDKKIANKKIALTRNSSGEAITKKLSDEKSNEQVLSNIEIKKLAEFSKKLEDHYNAPQDIEFAVENSDIYIVQTRPITTMKKRIEKSSLKQLKGEVILKGLAASPGIGVGKIKIVESLEDLQKIKKGDILVTSMTNPDMVVTMQKSSAIITDEGGLTAHAAIVSREMGIPCIVGTDEATTKLKEGETITVDGYSGKIYKGKVAEEEQKEILPVTTQTKTQLKVIVDLPTFAPRAAKTELEKVGLTRLEGIIAESGKHPNYFLEKNDTSEYEKIIYNGVKEIGKHFKEIWVRTSDIRSDEYQNLEGAPEADEANPMLGMHGIRFHIKNPKLLKAELNALKRVSSEENTKIGLLLPQLISVEELQFVKKTLKEIEFNDCKPGVMIETPASIQIIKDLCNEGIKFISFGTNDLTQYMLALDRGNEKVQHLYNETHPAILKQLEYVIRVCKRNKVETSICGQAGSKKEMVKFLVEKGIDSISVNADVAKEISEHIKEIEEKKLSERGELPRQYQPNEKNNNQERDMPKINGSEKSEENNQDENSNEEYLGGEKAIDETEKEKNEYMHSADYENEKKEDNSNENKNSEKSEENNQDENSNEEYLGGEKAIDETEKEKNEYMHSADYENEKKEDNSNENKNSEKSEENRDMNIFE